VCRVAVGPVAGGGSTHAAAAWSCPGPVLVRRDWGRATARPTHCVPRRFPEPGNLLLWCSRMLAWATAVPGGGGHPARVGACLGHGVGDSKGQRRFQAGSRDLALSRANALEQRRPWRHAVYGMQAISASAPLESSDSPEQTEASNKRGKPTTAIARFPSCQEPDRFRRGRLARRGGRLGPLNATVGSEQGQRNRAQFHTKPRLRRHL
jgi:hypothetical protein